MCLSLALVCSEVDGIVVIYLWPPSFAYSKILTRGRYLSRHSRCLRVTRYSERFSRRAASTFSRSIATRGLRDGCLHAVAATTTSAAPPRRCGKAVIQSTKCRGHRRQPLEVHEEPLPVLHLLDEPAVAEPANFISIFALGVLLGGAPACTLKAVGILHLDVPSLGAAHADRLAGGHFSVARLLFGLFFGLRGCPFAGFGRQRQRATSKARGAPGRSGAWVESRRESSARLGFVFALRGCPFCASRPAPNVPARSHSREALVAPRLLRARE